MQVKLLRASVTLLLTSALFTSALVCPAAAPSAYAIDVPAPDLCDLPGCGILEKGIEKGAELGLEANKPLLGAGESLVGGAKTAYDLATDPLGYFSEKFARANGSLIKELGGELEK